MATLDTVQDYITAARILLQDQVEPYRYPDSDLLLAFNLAFLEARKLRADLFSYMRPCDALPSFTAVNSTKVRLDPQYRLALVFFICGHVQLKDDEGTQDSRAGAFLGLFNSKLLTLG